MSSRAVKFTTDKNGRRAAWMTGGGLTRWCRVGLAEAELAVSTGKARLAAPDAVSWAGALSR